MFWAPQSMNRICAVTCRSDPLWTTGALRDVGRHRFKDVTGIPLQPQAAKEHSGSASNKSSSGSKGDSTSFYISLTAAPQLPGLTGSLLVVLPELLH